ncbi:PH domain-containing protein [Cellulomonas sp. zg-ZUI222]|uniref:PH domain-containing protein n=1 Tax=Cellulomonas TaxID=1707 RepID=UPI001A93D030|nr:MULTISPECIES: PH domain-containing protein [Cellulomonas]MBO0901113.1 PH domain-containing protein [Cellulomonas sp. zg-ZUI22]MBO0922574.1 PH domain-containing protein [Cellulomonas wangleii]
MTADHATRIVMSHRLLRRYVLPGERVVLATRRHWAKLLEPAATTLAVFAVCGWLTAVLQPSFGDGALVVWWLWLAALVRFGWYLLVWRVEWFVATDKRMLLLTGLVTHQIGMMPLMKVTDMRYSRSVLGQMLGYGQFLLESAGQDQALRQIGWVARPDATYRDLCALIFTPVTAPASDGEDDGGPVPPARRRPVGRPPAVPPARRVPAAEGGVALADASAEARPGPGPRPGARPAAPHVPPAGGREAGAPERWVEPVVVWPSREALFEPDDTQPLRLRTPDETDDPDATSPEDAEPARRLPPTLAEAAADGTSIEAEAIAGEEALRLDEEEAQQRAWDVSEPTGTFVDLGRREWSDDAGAHPSPTPQPPAAGPAPDIEGNPEGGRT